MHVQFDTHKQCLLDGIRINEKLKDILGKHRVSKVRMAENLSMNAGGPGLVLLSNEANCVCHLRLFEEEGLQTDVLDPEAQMFVGIAQLEIE